MLNRYSRLQLKRYMIPLVLSSFSDDYPEQRTAGKYTLQLCLSVCLHEDLCLSDTLFFFILVSVFICLCYGFSMTGCKTVCVTVLAWQVVKPRSRFTSLSLLGKECSIGRSSSSASFRRRRYRCSHDCVCFHVGSQLAWQSSVWDWKSRNKGGN